MLWWLLQNTLITAVLAIILAVLCRVCRFSPALRHALWLVLLIKLVTPPLVTWPWQLPDLCDYLTQVIARAPEASVTVSSDNLPLLLDQGLSAETLATFLSANESAGETTALAANPSWLDLPPWLIGTALTFWLIGVTLVLGLQILRIQRMRRLLVHGEAAPPWLHKLVSKLRIKLRVRRPQTLVVPGIHSPFVWGLGRSKIAWPTSLVGRLPSHSLRSVLVHELAHLRRRDHWVAWFLLPVKCLWWWNPVFWFVYRQVRLNAELACDAWVMWALPEDRRAYAEALIEVTQHVSLASAPLPALGMGGGKRQAFEKRLTMIMRERVACKIPLAGLIAIGFLALAALPTWSQVINKVEAVPQKTAPRADTVSEDVIYVVTDQEDVNNPAPSDRDKKLQALEGKLQDLIKEIHALRSGDPKSVTSEKKVRFIPEPAQKREFKVLNLVTEGEQPPPVHKTEEKRMTIIAKPVDVKEKVHVLTEAKPHFGFTVQAPDQPPKEAKKQIQLRLNHILLNGEVNQAHGEINLSRATYHLSKGQADTLVGFFRDHVKAPVMETKVDGDALIITTTPEAQKAIGQLIRMIQGNKSASSKESHDAIFEAILDGVQLTPDKPDSHQHQFEIHFAPDKAPANQNKPADKPVQDKRDYEIYLDRLKSHAKPDKPADKGAKESKEGQIIIDYDGAGQALILKHLIKQINGDPASEKK